MILNEQKEICNGQNTGVFLDKKQFLVEEDGQIHLPFENSHYKEYKAILFHENFASISKVSVPPQTFVFNGHFLYNPENIRQGEICTI